MMFDIIRRVFGMSPSANYKALLKEGGRIVDVRSTAEYSTGHIKGSLNIPLESLLSSLRRIDKNKAVITCCTSGMRSGTAKALLREKGYSKVFNGGSWRSLQKKLR